MAISTGVNRTLYWKKETTWGDEAHSPATGAKALRRVTSSLQLSKDTYEAQEISSHMQISDFRHGGRRVSGTIAGELSPGTYSAFFGALCRKYTWVSWTQVTGLTLTVVGTANPYTVTRAAGSWLTDNTTGVKVGSVVKLGGSNLNAANKDKNLLVINVTATDLTVIDPAAAMVAESSKASSTCDMAGKYTYAPGTSQDNPIASFIIEDFHNISGTAQSERFWGNRINSIQVQLPATGMTTISMDVLGRNMTTATTQWSSAPSAATTTGLCGAINGAIIAGSTMTQQTAITSANFTIVGGLQTSQLVGSNYTPDIFAGRVAVNGEITALFENGTLRDEFINETESGLVLWTRADNLAAGDFVSFAFPSVKWGAATKNDGEGPIVQTLSFRGLYNSSGGDGVKTEKTSFWIQDSQAA